MNYMEEALEQAKFAASLGEVPVGAVIVYHNKIISKAYNLVETRRDPLAHAEMLVLQESCKILSLSRLTDCDMYVTLEPCTMCAGAISHARIRRLYFGAFDPKGGGVDHGARFFNQPTCHHQPEVYGGILERESTGLLQSFFVDKR